ncbi:MAG: low temperature requirement protein A [Acidimicrobiia bacterium]|nr:low temperature requirement protein A [Acidimicrobiia bacterium]
MLSRFKRRFWLPPRAHGEIIEDRTVSFLELFYDLVFVVVIAEAAHTLAKDVSWQGVGEFAAVFGLIWLAWLNGTTYYELHGREEGRTRTFVFIQMLLLALLAVFTGDATGDTGAQFAIVYTLLLIVISWLWYVVRRQDSEEYMAVTACYLSGMAFSVVIMAISVFLPDGPRTIVWGSLVLVWGVLSQLVGGDETVAHGMTVTDSMAERFGLFVIIVLGEVVVGVVDGISEAELTARTIATGIVSLMIGFAYWWTYFDYVGRRVPRDEPGVRVRWMTLHLPTTMSIAAAGAAMVSLIEHAGDASTPAATAWLLTGSVAIGLLALSLTIGTLKAAEESPDLYRPVARSLIGAALAVLVLGWLAPAPWLLALSTVAVLSVVWQFAVDRWLRHFPDVEL